MSIQYLGERVIDAQERRGAAHAVVNLLPGSRHANGHDGDLVAAAAAAANAVRTDAAALGAARVAGRSGGGGRRAVAVAVAVAVVLGTGRRG
jgi:hypothetical protein